MPREYYKGASNSNSNVLAQATSERPSLYFIGAMKSPESVTRERFDDVWDSIVEPVAKKLGLYATNARATSSVQIWPEIVRSLRDSHLIVADVTSDNTAVGYELGIAHCLCKCTILLKTKSSKVCFDLKDMNHICYDLNAAGIQKAKTELEEHIRQYAAAARWQSFDNPVMYAQAPSAASLAPELATIAPLLVASMEKVRNVPPSQFDWIGNDK